MNPTDSAYQRLINMVITWGALIETRNHAAYSLIDSDVMMFAKTPLVTVRKTAWRKALREMEWFLSGDSECPDDLKDWWDGQLSPADRYIDGYGNQLRHWGGDFDQVQHLIDGLTAHPASRRHILTTWNAVEMADITTTNRNPNTPTCCHGTVIQYFVRSNQLHASHYQRSADLLLGLPHNLIQHWALLLWLATQSGLQPGSLRWILGDAHIYAEPTHLEVAHAIINTNPYERTLPPPTLVYQATPGIEFKAHDFALIGTIAGPVTTTRPRLL